MLKYFQGSWKLFREIRSLVDTHYIGIVNEAVASYHPWTDTEGQENPGPKSETPNKDKTEGQRLLYRESGTLENFDFPAASGHFTRQYLYKFPPSGSNLSSSFSVFHCSKLSLKIQDTDPLNSHFDPAAFKEGDFFHDLVFPRDVNWESIPVKGGEEPVTAVGQHLCGKDTYKGTFQIYSKDHFKTSWKVTGPEKAFQIVSIYTRLPI